MIRALNPFRLTGASRDYIAPGGARRTSWVWVWWSGVGGWMGRELQYIYIYTSIRLQRPPIETY